MTFLLSNAWLIVIFLSKQWWTRLWSRLKEWRWDERTLSVDVTLFSSFRVPNTKLIILFGICFFSLHLRNSWVQMWGQSRARIIWCLWLITWALRSNRFLLLLSRVRGASYLLEGHHMIWCGWSLLSTHIARLRELSMTLSI